MSASAAGSVSPVCARPPDLAPPKGGLPLLTQGRQQVNRINILSIEGLQGRSSPPSFALKYQSSGLPPVFLISLN